MSILMIENLSHEYGDHTLYQKACLRLSAGDHMGITGLNGAGKSTLLRIIMGEVLPDEGQIWRSPKHTLGYLASVHPDRQPKELRGALSRCGVKRDHMMQTVGTLSGGEQSKVKLAQLSLQRSHLLVLDEPTNHLDQNAKEALIRAVQDFEGAVIMVTHEAGFYERITDRVIELG